MFAKIYNVICYTLYAIVLIGFLLGVIEQVGIIAFSFIASSIFWYVVGFFAIILLFAVFPKQMSGIVGVLIVLAVLAALLGVFGAVGIYVWPALISPGLWEVLIAFTIALLLTDLYNKSVFKEESQTEETQNEEEDENQ